MKSKNILLGVTASIAIYKVCEVIRRLLKLNFELSVVMTSNATQLISPRIFTALIGGRVYPRANALAWGRISHAKIFSEQDEFTGSLNWELEHISLAKRADLVLIVPATANIIGKIASGIADDLLTTTVIATRAPVLIAPAMNDQMYRNKIVQANIQRLKGLGFKFIGPKTGKLACGDIGVGHLAEVETIITKAKRELSL